ncbi:MAG: Rap1a/Tai family immunity protein [Acetobacteraceae bacterium]|nr:Rap1a/Tai family immunity protein [Acetobacteraceae bacterium]
MTLKALSLATAMLAGPFVVLLTVGAARAAVTEAEFPPKTVGQLVALCTAAKDDPMMTASVNYCHGFAEGAVIVETAHAAQRGGRKLFCLPNPPPASDAELAGFVSWANATPARLEQPAVDGMFLYLATKYPCGKKK